MKIFKNKVKKRKWGETGQRCRGDSLSSLTLFRVLGHFERPFSALWKIEEKMRRVNFR